MAVNGRTKGATAERKLAKLFSKWWGSDFARTPMSGGFATAKFREDWNAAGDLVTPDPTFPFCVESKKVEGWKLEQLLTSNKTIIHSWWKQTIDETPDMGVKSKMPLLVFTKNHSPLYGMMRYEDMSRVYGQNYENFFTQSMTTRMNGQLVVIFDMKHLFASSKEKWMYER